MPSSLERAFMFYWRILANDLPEPVAEFRAIPGRLSRLDFAFPDALLGIELHGATFRQGRHTRGQGFQDDRAKMNSLIELGWVTLEYTTQDVNDRPQETIDQIRRVYFARKPAESHENTPLRDFEPVPRVIYAPKPEILRVRPIHLPPFRWLHPPKLCKKPRNIPRWNNYAAQRQRASVTRKTLDRWSKSAHEQGGEGREVVLESVLYADV